MHTDDFLDALTCHIDRLGIPINTHIDADTYTAAIHIGPQHSLHIVTLTDEVWGIDTGAHGTTLHVLVSPCSDPGQWEDRARSSIHAVLTDSIVTPASIDNTAIL